MRDETKSARVMFALLPFLMSALLVLNDACHAVFRGATARAVPNHSRTWQGVDAYFDALVLNDSITWDQLVPLDTLIEVVLNLRK